MKTVALTVALLVTCAAIGAASDTLPTVEQQGLEHLCRHLGLRTTDISFRDDYTEPDSFRLAIVTDLMKHPLGMVSYLDGLRTGWVQGQPEVFAGILHTDLKRQYFPGRTGPYQADISEIRARYNLYFTNLAINQILSRAATYVDVIFPRSAEMMLARLSATERAFLLDEFKEIITVSLDEETMSASELRALEDREEAFADRFAEFATRIDIDPVVAAGVDGLRELLLEARHLKSQLESGAVSAEAVIEGVVFLPGGAEVDSYLGRQPGWKVGGPGADYYSGEYRFILDLGGNDIYDLEQGATNEGGTVIIDLGGNDVYRGQTDFAVGSGCLGVGLLLDFEGDDWYAAKSFGLGSGYFGIGILYDADGTDRYDGDTHVQGAGTFGLGLLIDESGRDIYNAALYSQGFGFTQGIGVVFDAAGSDSYYAGGKYKDFLRYEDHYLSLSQGFGYGLRPTLSGGIGAILDVEGNDTYTADIFAQASSYWWSLGLILDQSGNDNYHCFQYGQGAATHMALGLLVDSAGDDSYYGKGLMQGCGHDYSAGVLIDRGGNDTYTAYDLSQAAGSANGVGILLDAFGDDRYMVKRPDNTQGYGNPRRDFGSIGLFMDLSGTDQYLGNGRDDFYWRTSSRWGGGMDIELFPPDTGSN
jgi:hypothetical protein